MSPPALALAWWRRGGRSEAEESPDQEPVEPPDPPPELVGSRSPGVAALLEWTGAPGGHAVLDLGPSSSRTLRVYGEFARRVRFADVATVWGAEGWEGVLESLPPQPVQPYDFILGWDIVDRIPVEGRRRLMDRLVEVSAPDAALHMVVRGTREADTRPLRFELVATDRVQYRPLGPDRPARDPILPAEMERVLEPFRVVRGFTLKGGLREYVAKR